MKKVIFYSNAEPQNNQAVLGITNREEALALFGEAARIETFVLEDNTDCFTYLKLKGFNLIKGRELKESPNFEGKILYSYANKNKINHDFYTSAAHICDAMIDLMGKKDGEVIECRLCDTAEEYVHLAQKSHDLAQ